MSYERLAYDDQDTASQMHQDCDACSTQLSLPTRRIEPVDVTLPAPSLEFEDFPREVRKTTIEVSAAAAHLASRLHLHLD